MYLMHLNTFGRVPINYKMKRIGVSQALASTISDQQGIVV